MSEINKQNINILGLIKKVDIFVVKLLNYRILFRGILTFLKHRIASLITLFLVVLGLV